MILRRVITTITTLAALCTIGVGTSAAQQEKGEVQTAPVLKPVRHGYQPVPGPTQAFAAVAPEACAAPTEGRTSACLTPTSPDHLPSIDAIASKALAAGGTPIPEWCTKNAFNGRLATRTEVCEIASLTYTTSREINGTVTKTGEAYLVTTNYQFSDTGLDYWGHQIQIGAAAGWGDALNGTIEGLAYANDMCTTKKYEFPAQGISPVQTTRLGEAFFETVAVAPGAIGHCTTSWQVTARNAGYNDTTTTYHNGDFRCDNATAGNPRVGCVVPWYASPVFYSRSATPSLASHVEQAQTSGLPGATFDNPLHRTTSETIINTNRDLACGDAPSITGYSCDEYPLASTYEGLSAGGTRRTFDGCNFNLPAETGLVGVSVCMIPATENNSQGGTMSQFYRSERVLDFDPYRVIVTS
nr:hypothetical protein KitaXyl93_22840 [Kitasatospora sp. Xyl93]